jgi:outer membrane lipoprotein carrier protein
VAHREVSDRGKERAHPEAADGRLLEGLKRRAAGGRTLVAATLLLFVAPGSSPSSAQRDNRPPIEELTVALQAKYDAVSNFSADFEHTYSGGVLRTSVVERGTVQIKKPGMMRWRYTWPEEKLFVSDGASLYSYIPADRQVIVGTVPAGDSVSTPALFLAGRGRLAQDFVIAYDGDDGAPPDRWSLGLTPIRDDTDYDRMRLVVDRASLSFTQLRATDFQGAVSTFTFSNLKENENMPDALFAFEIPAGADVITEDGFGR